jgi:MFS family permease
VRVYAAILRTPGVAMIVLATLIGRLPIGITGLAILLYVEEVSDSFAAAGVCAGALALGSAAGAPFQGRLIDRHGAGMLLPLALAHAAGLVSIWLAGEGGAPVALLAVLSLATGVSLPPLSSVLRSRWPYLLPGRPELLAGAFALDSVMIEVIFVIGPLATTVVVATVGAQYALIVSAACVFLGTAWLLAGLAGQPGPERTEAGRSAFGLGALASPGLRTLVLASMPLGFTFGTLEVVLPAFSEAEGSKELAGVLLAAWSAASAAGGLAWGALGATAPLLRAHMAFATVLPLCIAPLLLAGSPLSMALLVVLAGLPMAPLIASRNQLVERVVLPGTATEAYTWPLTALVAGVALGAAAGGAVVEASSWSAGVVLGLVVALLGTAVVLGRRRTLTQPLAVSG